MRVYEPDVHERACLFRPGPWASVTVHPYFDADCPVPRHDAWGLGEVVSYMVRPTFAWLLGDVLAQMTETLNRATLR